MNRVATRPMNSLVTLGRSLLFGSLSLLFVAILLAGQALGDPVTDESSSEIPTSDDSVLLPPLDPEALMAAGRVRLRIRTEPDATTAVVLGQQTRLLVEILTDSWFSHAPRYPELNLPGAITLLPEQMGTNFTEQIDGVTFAGQRRGYVIFPQHVGMLEIPPLEIRLGVSQEGRDGEPFVVTTSGMKIEVVERSGAEGREGLFTTPRIVVSDDWDRSLVDLRAGDAIQRTVRLEADQMLGMLLPELVFEAPAGVAVYPDLPRILDHVNRGQYRGERVQTVTYVLQEGGRFELPAIELHWWDPVLGQLESETLPAQALEVSGPGLDLSISSRISGLGARILRAGTSLIGWVVGNWVVIACAGLVGVVFVRVLGPALPRLRTSLMSARERRRESESQAFRNLEKSLSAGNDAEIVQAYWLWRDRIESESPERSAEAWIQFANAEGRSRLWNEFETSRYGGGPTRERPFDVRALRPELRRLRAAFRTEARSGPDADSTATLGSSSLNPRQ